MVPYRLAALLALTSAAAFAQTSLRLIPAPREIHPASTQAIAQGVHVTCGSCPTDSADNFTAQDLTESLAARRIPTSGAFTIVLTRSQPTNLPPEAQAEGYTIAPGANGITLAAPTSTGLFYAAQTLKQLIVGDGSSAVLHMATIRDWPAMQYRGVHDDLSRGPIPTLAFQESLIRTLAAYKYNLYSPYFEHTQQYASNTLPAPPGGSISADDARALVAYAAQFHVTIVPEQEAFGHLHHNLTWEEYSPLAETPHGTVLSPTQPGSLSLIGQMFGELAALYPGPFLHIGADETVDLGLGQTRPEVDARGLGPVYLDFLQQIDAKLAPLHRRLLFWGDIAQTLVQGTTAYTGVGATAADHPDPNLLKNLPAQFKKDTIAVAWWYTPQPKGFARFLEPFTTTGFETWVAPGVNNWSVVFPDNNDALANIQQFVAEGQRERSTGMLNTIWYDDGEGLPNQNWFGLLFGAAAAWQPGEASIPNFEHGFGEVFHGDQTGDLDQAQLELMACHDILRNQAHVGDGSDGLFWIDPWSLDGQKTAAKIRPYAHEMRLHAERALTLIANARAAYPAPASQIGLSSSSFPLSSSSAPLSSPSFPFPSRGAAEGSASGTTPELGAWVPFPSNPTTLHHPDAIDAMELGARRMDFIGLKFQLADEMVQSYSNALLAQASPDKKLHAQVAHDIGEIRSVNGRLEDIRDTYSLLRDLYQQAWLKTNRPYALRPILEHYDSTIALWQSRIDRIRAVQRQYADSKTLPTAFELGLPAGTR